jgi:hypothetical protein
MRYGDPPRDPHRAAIVADLLRLADLIRHIEDREMAHEESAASGTVQTDPVHDALSEIRVRRAWLQQHLEAIVEAVKS